ncbi:MAG: class I SAM-dependent methyltransferase [Bacteroidetes bacterium]|nr:class I SAM-dependent methyltransferase [Bacteroidota bacterium]
MSFFKVFSLKWIYDNRNPDSVSNKLRRRRLNLLVFWLKKEVLPGNYRNDFSILDLGGTELFWHIHGSAIQNQIGRNLSVTIVNNNVIGSRSLDTEKLQISVGNGDARNLEGFSAGHFDLIFSNSVIEHVGTFDEQKKMADEIKRVGKFHFVQTPNPLFPIEPHFHVPFWVFLPEGIKIWLLTHFSLGWYPKQGSKIDALNEVKSINLIPLKKFRILFQSSVIKHEKIFGISKSFIAIGKGSN